MPCVGGNGVGMARGAPSAVPVGPVSEVAAALEPAEPGPAGRREVAFQPGQGHMREMACALRDLGRPKLLPKMSMVWSNLSRPKEQALNIEPKGSDRSGQRTCLDCPVSVDWQIRTVPNQSCERTGPSAQQMAQAALQAHVESSGGWAPSGRGHRPHCAAACATRRRELHCSTELPAPIRPLSRPPRCQHALSGSGGWGGRGVRHHAALEAGGPRVRGTDHARIGFHLCRSSALVFMLV
jgi:hypothetical protein